MENPRTVLINQIKSSLSTINRLLEKLETENLQYQPSNDTRKLGEILLHIIRSFEYYLKGMVTQDWNALPYSFDEYNSLEKISDLYKAVKKKVLEYTDSLERDVIHNQYERFNQTAFGLNLLVELLHHNAHHLGQLSIYLRELGIEPPTFEYIV